MDSIIHQIYYGDPSPADQTCTWSEEYRAMLKKRCAEAEDFMARLAAVNPALKTEFIEILDGVSSAGAMETGEIFCQGFRMGAQLMLEIMEKA